ncbi:alpha/beta hydrolase family protein [Microbulbifer epialgicus]|uniref:Alpha/beta hydrolase family protein n=1 Tax=Microbulbifer epialgicus TaxID=393907 RepID=A0ABV4NV81_9GAMM
MHKLIVFLVFFWTSQAFGTQVPLSDLVRHRNIQEIKISPAGTHIAVKRLHKGKRVLVFMSLNPLDITGVLNLWGDMEVGNFYWANDERVVAEIWSRRGALESPVSYGNLWAINYDGKRGKNIFGYLAGERQLGTRIPKAKSTNAHATIIDPLPHKKNEILVSTTPWVRDRETAGEVLRINIYSGVKKKVAGLPQASGRAYTDRRGNLSFATGTDKNNNYQLYKKAEDGWTRIEDKTLAQGRPVGIDHDNNEFYFVIDRPQKTEQLVKLNPETNNLTNVFSHEITDINGIIYSPDKKPIGVYLHPTYPTEHFFDEGNGFAAYFRGIKKAFEGYRVRFTSFTSDGTKGILEVYGDRLPGDYFLVDIKTKKIDFIASSSKWLDPLELNPMLADFFISEDEFRIGTYLTFPKNSKEKLPMVVIPHGGPHSRDYWKYNQKAQILSQNGYLVLQVNFRGSTGYGDHFYTAGEREWGGKIQKDIADAVHWAIEKGYADPERVCIYGASFGGYSALMNPIRYPGLYKCAAGYVGVYNLEMMYKKGDIKRRDRGLAYLKRELSKDKNFLKENSPIHNTDKLNIPLFIIHGRLDERAPIEHAEELLEKLEKEGKPAKSLIVANEGHGFYSEENNMRLYTELLAFLDKHIGVGSVEKQPAVNQ